MPVGVDETRHRDHAGRIDHLGTLARKCRADRGDVLILDSQIANDKLAVVAIEREQVSPPNQIRTHQCLPSQRSSIPSLRKAPIRASASSSCGCELA